ncbi:glycoside hydrolase family 71 protein [Aspergillus tanneri]|uniref:Mutanase n=1 Tax=Aspergillus tanneri TaxID=1220188 RepID=A0A5M9MFV8_9EURO|nr:uncharacterized protein ATNIH1004_008403 [Aspergillus tanneri]KAA8644204.1 hypothetical protein ATNIH1004_008403 [Aspergillus tanneri]
MKADSLLVAASLLSSTTARAVMGDNTLSERDPTNRLVFAHFMMGTVSNRQSASDYDDDMKSAKALGIDAFALNIGTDDYTNNQLDYAYESAANNNMKVFISFDFNWWRTDQASQVGQTIVDYAGKPGQLIVDNKPFVSSFSGDGLDVGAVRHAAGQEIFFAPNFNPAAGTDVTAVDGLLNWIAWPNNGNNKAPTAGESVSVSDGDKQYVSTLGDKAYIAPASPWFFTHYGSEVSYSKNFVLPSDTLWYDRWNEILTLGPRFVEIITWNDYGESHYVGPLSSHTDDGNSKWVNDMPHEGWLDLSKPYIAAFKAGDTSVDKHITEDKLIYWYRPAHRNTNCDTTDTCMEPADNSSGNYFIGRPNGWDSMEDSVFVVSLLTSPATVQLSSGENSRSFEAPAGASSFKVDMGVGKQKFSAVRDGKEVLSGTSLKDVVEGCACGFYNFNAYVGTLPAGDISSLQPEALSSFSKGLKRGTCQAPPSVVSSTPAATP